MQDMIEILKAQAKAYLMLAKSLKEQGIDSTHYIVAAKKCCDKAIEIRKIEEAIEFEMAA